MHRQPAGSAGSHHQRQPPRYRQHPAGMREQSAHEGGCAPLDNRLPASGTAPARPGSAASAATMAARSTRASASNAAGRGAAEASRTPLPWSRHTAAPACRSRARMVGALIAPSRWSPLRAAFDPLRRPFWPPLCPFLPRPPAFDPLHRYSVDPYNFFPFSIRYTHHLVAAWSPKLPCKSKAVAA